MAERGQDYILQASSTGSSYTTVGKVTNLTLSRTRETVDTNNFDSPDWKESLSTMREWGIEGEALYVYDDAGQVIIEAAYAANTAYYFKLTSTDGTAGVIQWRGQGYVTDASVEFSTNEVVTYSLSVQGTGALTAEALT